MRTSSSSAAVAAPSIALCASRSRTSGSMRRLYPTMGAVPGAESPYDAIARLYDPWSRSVTEDVDFYVEEAVASGGPVVELGVGTGRIAVPVAAAGVTVIGVDWDTAERTLTLSVRDDERASTMTLAWLDPREWQALLEAASFEVLACYGWF